MPCPRATEVKPNTDEDEDEALRTAEASQALDQSYHL